MRMTKADKSLTSTLLRLSEAVEPLPLFLYGYQLMPLPSQKNQRLYSRCTVVLLAFFLQRKQDSCCDIYKYPPKASKCPPMMPVMDMGPIFWMQPDQPIFLRTQPNHTFSEQTRPDPNRAGWLVGRLASPFSTKIGYIEYKVLGDLVLPGLDDQRYSNLPTSLQNVIL